MSVPEERQLEVVLENALGPAGRIANALGRLGMAVQLGLTDVDLNPEIATEQSRESAQQLVDKLKEIEVVCAALSADIAARTGLPDRPKDGETWSWEVRALGPQQEHPKKLPTSLARARATVPLQTIEGKQVPVKELPVRLVDPAIIPAMQFEPNGPMEEVELIITTDKSIKIGDGVTMLPKDQMHVLNVLLLFRDRELTGPEIKAYDFLPNAKANSRETAFARARRELDRTLVQMAGKPEGSFVVKTEQNRYYLGYKIKVTDRRNRPPQGPVRR